MLGIPLAGSRERESHCPSIFLADLRLTEPTSTSETIRESAAKDTSEKTQRRAPRNRSAFRIVVDTREPVETAWTFGPDVEVTRACLPSGDYAPAGLELVAAIERKTAADFVACVTYERARFWAELQRLRDYSMAVVIVETSVEAIMAGAYISRANPWAVLTSALAIMADFRIPVLFAGDRENAARCGEWLLRRFATKIVEGARTDDDRRASEARSASTSTSCRLIMAALEDQDAAPTDLPPSALPSRFRQGGDADGRS